MKPIEPTPQQLQNCKDFGWLYLEDGIFCKGDILGYFTAEGFFKA